MLTCSVCHKPVREGALFCSSCRANLIRQCMNCGQQNRATARFCSYCRTQLVQTCSNCGDSIRPGARFCQHCGADVSTAAQASLFAPVQSPQPAHASITPVAPVPLHSSTISVAPSHGTGLLPAQTTLNGRYVVLSKVAAGGMGAVYKAMDTRHSGQVWAIKEMSQASIPTDELAEAIANFKSEAAVLSRLNHPNLPKVVESFEDNHQRHYMVMEFIEGQTLLEMLEAKRGKPLAEAKVLELAAQLCDVLEYLHTQPQPIVYRDLKPENVMVEQATGRLKLIDFGIVRFYKAGKSKDTVAIGTIGYAPPEQSVGQTDARSDIYALGATLHHLLTGRDPKKETPWIYPAARKLNPSLSLTVDQALDKALQTSRDKRPQSIAEFRDLLGIGAGKGLPLNPGSRPTRSGSTSSSITGSHQINFGSVVLGNRTTQSLKLCGAVTTPGAITAFQPWLQASTRPLSGNQTEINITADSSYLALGRSKWSLPDWFVQFWRKTGFVLERTWWILVLSLAIATVNAVGLYVILFSGAALVAVAVVQLLWWWIMLHATWFIKKPQQYQAQLEVRTSAGLEQVDASVLVTPDPVQTRWRWAGVIALVVLEVASVYLAFNFPPGLKW